MTEYILTGMDGAALTPGAVPFTDLSEARAAALDLARTSRANVHVCVRETFGPHEVERVLIVCTPDGRVYPNAD